MKSINTALTRRAAALIAVLAGALAMSAPLAHADGGVGGSATPSFPSVVTVGQKNVAAHVTLTNQNSGSYASLPNTVCNAGDGAPCPGGTKGITLTPSCGALGDDSSCAAPDNGVLSISNSGTGAGACAGTNFAINAVPGSTTGQLRFVPQGPSNVTLAANGASCEIDFTFDVLKLPTIDQDSLNVGVQTAQITDNLQYNGSLTNFNRGTSNGMTVQQATPTIVTRSPMPFSGRAAL